VCKEEEIEPSLCVRTCVRACVRVCVRVSVSESVRRHRQIGAGWQTDRAPGAIHLSIYLSIYLPTNQNIYRKIERERRRYG
jgi:hypothetical protein